MLLAITAALIVLAAGLFIARLHLSAGESTNPSLDGRILNASVPVLTPRERHQAITLAEGDRTVRRLIGTRRVSPRGVLTWTQADGEVLGGLVRLALPRPAELRGRWLALDYDCTESISPPYRSLRYSATRTRVGFLLVFVDLQRSAAVAVEPNTDAGFQGPVRIPRQAYLNTCQHI